MLFQLSLPWSWTVCMGECVMLGSTQILNWSIQKGQGEWPSPISKATLQPLVPDLFNCSMGRLINGWVDQILVPYSYPENVDGMFQNINFPLTRPPPPLSLSLPPLSLMQPTHAHWHKQDQPKHRTKPPSTTSINFRVNIKIIPSVFWFPTSQQVKTLRWTQETVINKLKIGNDKILFRCSQEKHFQTIPALILESRFF